MALTKAEQHLLKYPPTERTWVCQAKRKNEDGTTRKCSLILSGPNECCYLCGTPKPAKPVLLWPQYLAACKKAGFDPIPAQVAESPPEHLRKKRSVKRGR